MEDAIVAYIPVIHRGYLDYLASTGAKRVYAIQAGDVPKFEQLSREIRSLTVEELALSLKPHGYDVHPFSELVACGIPKGSRIFMPEDDITRSLSFEGVDIVWGSWFLRWDWSKATIAAFHQPEADRVLKRGDDGYVQASERMLQLLAFAKRSSDFWRQVAAMAVAKNGTVLMAYNKHYPTEHAPYMDGDPRTNFNPGEFVEIYTSLHGETGVIAEAARRGISLQGAELTVTTFPCNLCASSIAASGFEKVFFTGGYSNLNGQRTLREHGVELIYVEM